MWQPKLPPVSVPARASRDSGGRPRPLYLRIVDALAADVAAGRVAPAVLAQPLPRVDRCGARGFIPKAELSPAAIRSLLGATG